MVTSNEVLCIRDFRFGLPALDTGVYSVLGLTLSCPRLHSECKSAFSMDTRRSCATNKYRGSGRGSCFDPRVSRKGLQPKAAALGNRLPAAGRVRSQSKGCRYAAAFCMSFSRHQEIFPSDGGVGLAANAPAHRLDEFPAGYSSAGCSPAEPASAWRCARSRGSRAGTANLCR